MAGACGGKGAPYGVAGYGAYGAYAAGPTGPNGHGAPVPAAATTTAAPPWRSAEASRPPPPPVKGWGKEAPGGPGGPGRPGLFPGTGGGFLFGKGKTAILGSDWFPFLFFGGLVERLMIFEKVSRFVVPKGLEP